MYNNIIYVAKIFMYTLGGEKCQDENEKAGQRDR